MPSFLPYSYRAVISGIFDVVFTWAVISALLSLAAVIVAFLTDPTCALQGKCNILSLTPEPLVNKAPYAPLKYYEYLWVVLLIAALIGGFIYMISLSQSEEEEYPADYYNLVAKKAIAYVGGILLIWLIAPVVYVMIYNGTLIPSDILQAGLQGLRATGSDAPVTTTDYIFNYIHPFWPGAVFVAAIFYVIRNAHTGWFGDKWTEGGG